LKTHLAAEEMPYDGSQLRSHFAFKTFGIHGDSIVSFLGPCHVDLDHMVDLEDVVAREGIESPLMLHLIAEHFDAVIDLEKAVLRQRLLVSIAAERLGIRTGPGLVRSGDDLMAGTRKLSVSIATRSPVSTLIHLGLNVVSDGAPVPIIGLRELDVDPRELAVEVMAAYARENDEIDAASSKVRGVQ